LAGEVDLTSVVSLGTDTGEGPFIPADAARAPRHGRHSVSDPPEIVQRALCVVAALGLLVLAEVNFGVGVSSPWRAQISPLGFVLAIGLAR
jgi:hypothetical protein